MYNDLRTGDINDLHEIAFLIVKGASDVAIEDDLPMNLAIREQIVLWEERFKNAPEEYKVSVSKPTVYFWDGMACKQTTAKAGTVLTGMLYKKPHMFSVLKGKVTHVTEEGVETLEQGYIGVYPAGIKRIAIVEEDCTVALFIQSDATTIEELDKDISATSYSELGMYDPDDKDLLDSLGGTTWQV